MSTAGPLVILLDIDNTLFDNDRFAVDLAARLRALLGAAEQQRYQQLLARLREQLGYVDYLAALQLMREGLEDCPELLTLADYVLEYPFAQGLFPQALEVVQQLGRLGTTVVLSDGDVVLQPRKARRSGIWDAVGGRVLIYKHKELMLDALQRRFPSDHYAMVDDKPGLLAAMKRSLGTRLCTVFVRQGHYALEANLASIDPPPDRVVGSIADLLQFDRAGFLPPGS